MTQNDIKQQFSHMNPMQQQAVFCTEGPLLILAGAGSGKTTVLVNRIAYILQSGLCRPWNILAITFTNKAAGELKERICSTVPEGGGDIWAATFHSTCARILRRYGDRLGYSSHFTVYATDDQKRLMTDIAKQLNIDVKILPVKAILSEISKAKDRMMTPQEMLREAEHDFRRQSIAKAYEIYQDRLKTADAMDFDDLLCKTVELFRGVEDWFDRITRFGLENGVRVEHYVISSGMKEIIEGTSISRCFKSIFACEFLYDENGGAVWPKTDVNYTNKTQFVYRINKGVLDVANDLDLNRSMPEDSKRVPFTNMIYIGDGLSDVPCMKMMKAYGGYSVAVYQKRDAKVEDLLSKDRVDFIYPADYSEGTGLDLTVKNIIRKISIGDALSNENANQLRQLAGG